MFAFFEKLIDPYRAAPPEPAPYGLMRFYFYFVRQVWPIFALLVVMGFSAAIIEVAMFAFLGRIVDWVKNAETPQAFFGEHGHALLWMAGVAFLLRPALFITHTCLKSVAVAPGFTNLIRWQTHRYVLRQSLGYFQNDFAGRIASKIIQTGPALRESMVQATDAIWFMLVYTGSALFLFAEADWLLILPLLVWVAVYVWAIAHFVPRIKDRAKIMSEARSTLTGRIVDSYTNIMTVKLFAHADREDAYASEAVTDHTSKFRAQQRLITKLQMVLWIINGALIVGTTGLALLLWTYGAITIGAIALSTGLVIRINNMSQWIMWEVTGIFENLGTVQEGMETIAQPYNVVDDADAPSLQVSRGQVVFDRVTFHYGRGGGIIEDLSLEIRPGERVGLVGRSGAGKSTIVNLLLRFHDLEGGRILVDGQDIALVTQDSLRAQIGVVTQDTSLLHRSVLANILYGNPNATEEDAIGAARQAHAHEFIPELVDMHGRRGYDAHVGERGVKLSGGQRQRIAIARVLLKNAPILVLDEATSALDSEVEAAIQEQLINLMRGKTVLAIAHRLSTVAAMDRLVVLDRGSVVEQGPHELLIARGGLYADLWARQSGGFLADQAA